MNKSKLLLLISILTAVMSTGCGGGGGGGGPTGGNTAPVANAGPDQKVATGAPVSLDGSGSSDANGDALTYNWSFTSRPFGSSAALSEPAAVNPKFTPDAGGLYVVQLVVNDGAADSAADTVKILAQPGYQGPMAHAGPDQNVSTGSLVTLDGSGSSDANGDPLTYNWSFTSIPGGSTAALSDAAAVNPTFTPDVDGAFVAQLIVNDGATDSAADTVTVTASTGNSEPLANAGPDQNVIAGALVTLDGSGSSDANGDALTYNWSFASKPGGSTAVLADASAINPTFTADVIGTYVVQLIVNDGAANGADAVMVAASAGNSAPMAHAGPDQSVIAGALVTLDGSGSSDANGDALTYTWSFTFRPSGSAAVLSGAATISPTFTPDVAGAYVAQLIVNDGAVDGTPDMAVITAAWPARLSRTGQSETFAEGDDGDLQTGAAWPEPRFTVTSAGPGMVATVTDFLTGLAWLQDANCIATEYAMFDNDGTAGDGGVTWQHALDFVAGMNAGNYPRCGAGFTDWRLPNRNELASLLANPTWLTSQGFSNVPSGNYYWSSTSLNAANAWRIHMNGNLWDYSKETTYSNVWPVRDAAIVSTISLPRTGQTTSYAAGDDGDLQKGVAWPGTRFSANADATVTDRLTGLVWAPDGNLMPARDSGWDADVIANDGMITWQHALDYVAKLNAENYLGHNDWRLPNVNELKSLLNAGQSNSALWLVGQGFSNIFSYYGYWSSTTLANDDTMAWAVYLNGQTPTTVKVGGNLYYVWPVRGGSSPKMPYYFSGNNGPGNELWISDGTAAGTVMVKNINSGGGSYPNFLTYGSNGTLFFSADNGTNGIELWKSDGTEMGTKMVKDINGGGDSLPLYLTNVNGTIFFRADDGSNGVELWKTDGTAAGTVPVKDIHPTGSSNPTNLTNVNRMLFFVATNGTDGFELWKSDGTGAGTVMVKDINSAGGSYPNNLANVNGTLYFSADNGTEGYELWKSDGTGAGTVMVKDIYPGAPSSTPGGLTNVNGTLFFAASRVLVGIELWKSDGTEAGTVMVKDINSTAPSASSHPVNLINVNGMLFFSASDGTNGIELWKSDGTAAGTIMVKDINSAGDSSPSNLTNVNGTLFFTANDGANGIELWKSDGSGIWANMVKDIRPGINASDPANLANGNGTLFFSADNGTNGIELWKSDGTEMGTKMVEDINPGPGNGY